MSESLRSVYHETAQWMRIIQHHVLEDVSEEKKPDMIKGLTFWYNLCRYKLDKNHFLSSDSLTQAITYTAITELNLSVTDRFELFIALAYIFREGVFPATGESVARAVTHLSNDIQLYPLNELVSKRSFGRIKSLIESSNQNQCVMDAVMSLFIADSYGDFQYQISLLFRDSVKDTASFIKSLGWLFYGQDFKGYKFSSYSKNTGRGSQLLQYYETYLESVSSREQLYES